MTIHIESSEHSVIQFIPKDSNYIQVVPFKNGDFQLFDTDGKLKMIIERKTLDDLDSSIKDNRYSEQRRRLQELDPKPQIGFLFEVSKNTNKLKQKHISGALVNLGINKEYHIFISYSPEHTMNILIDIHNKLLKETSKEKTNIVHNPFQIAKKDQLLNNFFSFNLQLVPSITKSSADEIMKLYPTMKSLMNAWEKSDNPLNMLDEIKVNNRKLGKKGQMIYNCFHQEKL